MRVMIFGATGMVGQGVLLECLRDPAVTRVLAVGRRPTGKSHPKLDELVHRDFFDWSGADTALTGWDACFFCLGVSSWVQHYDRLSQEAKLRLPLRPVYFLALDE